MLVKGKWHAATETESPGFQVNRVNIWHGQTAVFMMVMELDMLYNQARRPVDIRNDGGGRLQQSCGMLMEDG